MILRLLLAAIPALILGLALLILGAVRRRWSYVLAGAGILLALAASYFLLILFITSM